MNLEITKFQKEFYAEYASWFIDPELNRHLGPMGEDWFEAVLSMSESDGVTWAVFRDDELVAVVETVFDQQGKLPAGITAVAVKPVLRRQGIGTKALISILSRHQSRGIKEHIAFISIHNQPAQNFLKKAGFKSDGYVPDEKGYLKFRYCA